MEKKVAVIVPIIVAIIGVVGMVSVALIQNNCNGENGKEYELWSVEGKLSLKDKPQFDNRDVIISIKPPDQDLYRNGIFSIAKVPIKLGDNRKPFLLIKKTGYKFTEVMLKIRTAKELEDLKLPDYSINYDKKNKMIKIEKPIILVPESNSGG